MKEKYVDTGRKKQKLKTRAKILASAQSFLLKGEEFSLEDVAEHAGISRATVYRYYSKVEFLAFEAGLDLNTEKPEAVYEKLQHLNTEEAILGIQDHYNRFTIENEPALRKYLSLVITGRGTGKKRGARRKKALDIALKQNDLKLSKDEIGKLSIIATVLMGMEPVIITKDVCHLDNQKSLEILEWGLKMVLRGIKAVNKSST